MHDAMKYDVCMYCSYMYVCIAKLHMVIHCLYLCTYRKLQIHLKCDQNVPQENPGFTFEGEEVFFQYVSSVTTYVHTVC